jgi:hypothetical protein
VVHSLAEIDPLFDKNRLQVAPVSAENAASLKGLLGRAVSPQEVQSRGNELTPAQVRLLTAVAEQVSNARRGVFVWNLESYADVRTRPEGLQTPISAVYAVAAGLKPNFILHSMGFSASTRMVYFDYSAHALRVKQFLLEEWDGTDYPRFLQRVFATFPHPEYYYQLWDDVTPDTLDWNEMERLWAEEVQVWGGADAIRGHWERYRQLRHEFVECDLLTQPQELLARIDVRPGSVIWWSNAFFTTYSNWFYSADERWRFYERWVLELGRRAPDAFLYGADPENSAVAAIPAGLYAERWHRARRGPQGSQPALPVQRST